MIRNKKFRYTVYKEPSFPISEKDLLRTPELFDKYGQTIHQARNLIKFFDYEDKKINVKKFCIPPIINRFFYSIGIRTPKAKKSFLNAKEILKRGFSTPQPFAYIIEREKILIRQSYFLSEQLQNMTPIGHFCKDKDLLRALAQYTAKMHQKGCMHRDFTPGNILYSCEEGKYSFSLVDINRFKFSKKPIPLLLACKNLMQPCNDFEMLRFFVEEYRKARDIKEDLFPLVLHLKKTRNRYDDFKAALKKIPGANLLLGKPLSEKKETH